MCTGVRAKWNVHRSSVSIRINLDKEAVRLSARETRLIHSVGLGLSCFGFPIYLQTHPYLLFLLFKHLSFLSGTGLLPALAADNAFPSAESPRRLPRVASTQRRGLLEALSHLLMEESSKLVSGGNGFSLKVKRVKSCWVLPDTKFSP